MKGGYQIVDLGYKELTSGVGMVYEGIYNIIEGTTKPILIEGLNVGGVTYNATYVDFAINGSNFEGTIHGKTITISDVDVVTVTNA